MYLLLPENARLQDPDYNSGKRLTHIIAIKSISSKQILNKVYGTWGKVPEKYKKMADMEPFFGLSYGQARTSPKKLANHLLNKSSILKQVCSVSMTIISMFLSCLNPAGSCSPSLTFEVGAIHPKGPGPHDGV